MDKSEKIQHGMLDSFYMEHWKARDGQKRRSPARERRLSLIREALHSYFSETEEPSEQVVLDYGCGGGWLLEHLIDMNFRELHAYDVTPSVTKQISEKYPEVKVWTGEPGFPSALPEKSFDIVCSIEVIEHIPHEEQAAYMADLRRILRPAGLLILTTPNGRWKSSALLPERRQPIEDWITLPQLKRLAQMSGFRLVRCGTKGIRRYSRTDSVLQSYRIKRMLSGIRAWDSYIGLLEHRGRGITMYAFLRAQ